MSERRVPSWLIFLGVAAAIVATIHEIYQISDKESQSRAALISAFTVLLLITAYNARNNFFAFSRKISKRFRSPDVQNSGIILRLPKLLLWGAYRAGLRMICSPNFIVIVAGTFAGLLIWMSHIWQIYAEHTPSSDWVDSIYGASIFTGFTLTLTWLFYVFFSRLNEARQLRMPGNRVRDEIIYMVEQNAEIYENSGEQRSNIAIEDPGPIQVISATGSDLLRATGTFDNAFEAAWNEDPQKKFRLLLGDPAHPALRARDRRLNGRYLEYYVIPYFRMHLIWKTDQLAGHNRIEMNSLAKELNFRAVQSKDRMILQKYSKYQHGYKDNYIILNRVNIASDIENVLSKIQPYLFNEGDNSTNLGNVNQRSEFNDLLSGQLPLQSNTIYGRLTILLNEQFRENNETFITEWESTRLLRLAKYCGISKKIQETCRDNNFRLAHNIFDRLGLQEQFEELEND